MAQLLQDGSIKMKDGRIVWGRDQVRVIDIQELAQLLAPPTLPARGGFQGFGGGGGRGPKGDTGPAGPQGPPGPGGSSDIYAATRIVSQVAGEGTDLTLEDAISNLPAEGGFIFIREGTYTPPAGGYILPNAPVKIYGAGRGSTVFDLGSAADRVFSLGSSQYSFGDFQILGDGTVGQTCFFSAVASSFLTTTIERVSVGTNLFGASPVEIFYDGNSTMRQTNFIDLDVYNGTNATGFFIKNSAAGFRADFARCKVRGTPSVQFLQFSSNITFIDCLLFPAFPAANSSFTTPANAHLIAVGSTIVLVNAGTAFTIAGTCFFDSCVLSGLMSITFQSEIIGCLTSAITMSGSTNRIIGNRFSAASVGPHVNVTGGTGNLICSNHFEGIIALGQFEIENAGTGTIIVGNACPGSLRVNNTGPSLRMGENSGNEVVTTNYLDAIINDENATSVISTPFTVLPTNRTLLVNATAAPLVVNLPPAAQSFSKVLTIKKVDATANTVDITADGADTIDGSGVHQLTAQWESVRIICDGFDWFIEAGYP